jgi:K+-transporting ATPase KdpF subunit
VAWLTKLAPAAVDGFDPEQELAVPSEYAEEYFVLCEVKHGRSVHRSHGCFRGPEHGARARLRKTHEEAAMNWVYILSGVLAAGIFVYLVVALLWPEKF